jgi:hypothetical protein
MDEVHRHSIAQGMRELSRYFDDLEQIFTRVGFTTGQHDREIKQYAVRYVDYDTEQLWKSFAEYDDNSTYPAFKKIVLLNYPDVSGDFIYSIRDMDVLVGEKQHVEINTLTEMADYHMQFLAITKWLIKKKLLSNLEQQRAYTRAFQPVLLNAVMTCLQLKHPDHYLNIPHTICIEKVYKAARFVLQGSIPGGYYAPFASTYNAPPATNNAPQVKSEPAIKTKDLGAFLTEFAKIMKDTLSANQNQGRSYNNSKRCFFCGLTHTKPCKNIDDYLKEGKIKKNQEIG